jgi:uncharacterized SAM-binding protein YcdF (DUF218 family)
MATHLLKTPPPHADLIFVLAGRDYRKLYALKLFQQGLAPKILFSVSRFEIRRFSKMSLPIPLDLVNLASNVPPAERHFFVLFAGANVQVTQVQPHRLGTLTEIEALARWLVDHLDVRSVLLISSSSHLKRIRTCCRFILRKDLELFLTSPPTPLPNADDPHPLTATFLEAFKFLAYWGVLTLRRFRRPNDSSNPGEHT